MAAFFSLWFDQAVNGLVLGNIYALLAAGLALIFGVAELVNFAHGSVYMVGSYVGWLLITRLHWPLWAALVGAAFAGAAIGLILERVAVRPFRNAPRVAPLLATLGAGMVLDSLSEILFTPDPRSFPDIIPQTRFAIGGVSLGFLDILILALSAASALSLFITLKYTKLGKALRAAAQDTEAAQQMGIRVNRIHAASFAIASALGSLAGVLIGLYYNQISPTMGFQAVLKGFTACVLGGLSSIPASMAGGLILGLGESIGVGIFGATARNLIAFSMLLLALFFKPNGLFGGRGGTPKESLTGSFLPQAPSIRIPRPILVLAVAIAVLLPLFSDNPYLLQILTGAWISGLFATSLTLVAGTAGIMTLGHAGLLAIGAYTSALLSLKAGLPFWASFLLAGAFSAAIGTLLASPALRLSGHYVAIATIGIGEIVNQLILNLPDLTGGPIGIYGIPAPSLFGIGIVSAGGFYYLSLVVLLIGGVVIARIMASPLGRTTRAIREDEVASRALGIRPLRYKSLMFAVGAFFAGLSGALTAHLYTYISYDTFGSNMSILGLTMTILGGLGNIWGAVLGSVVLTVLPEVLRFASEFRWLAYGVILLSVLRARPQGLLGSK